MISFAYPSHWNKWHCKFCYSNRVQMQKKSQHAALKATAQHAEALYLLNIYKLIITQAHTQCQYLNQIFWKCPQRDTALHKFILTPKFLLKICAKQQRLTEYFGTYIIQMVKTWRAIHNQQLKRHTIPKRRRSVGFHSLIFFFILFSTFSFFLSLLIRNNKNTIVQ
jgi:hypothetical protein